MGEVTAEIQAHLMKAMELSIAAQGNLTGNYAIIAQASVGADGTFVMPWQRYYGAQDSSPESIPG